MNNLIEEERFNQWISSLESCQSQLIVNDDLIISIKDVISKDNTECPEWVKKIHALSKLRQLTSLPIELKTFLRHVASPAAHLQYVNLHAAVTSESESPEQYQKYGLSTFEPWVCGSNSSMDEYLSHMHDAHNGDQRAYAYVFSSSCAGIIGLCKLADSQHKLCRAQERDASQVKNFLAVEVSRRGNADKAIDESRVRLTLLDRTTEPPTLARTIVDTLRSDLDNKAESLRLAEQEEQAARLVYEAAMEKRRKCQLASMNSDAAVRTTTKQLRLLSLISSKRIELENYNKLSSCARLDMLSNMSSYLDNISNLVNGIVLRIQVPQMFEDLSSTFIQNLPDCVDESVAQDQGSVIYYGARCGLESVRLWRQLCAIHSDCAGLVSNMDSFEKELNDQLAEHKCPETVAGGFADSTVVLFFDHVTHSNPGGHVESQARVNTCLTAIAEQLTDQYNSRKVRQLQLLNCNNITGPPTWCLPLVHAPSYLTQLWSLAAQADKNDSMVPLEFDSELESVGDEDEDDLETGRTGSVSGRQSEPVTPSLSKSKLARFGSDIELKASIELPGHVKDSLDPTVLSAVEQLLTGRSGDEILARVVCPCPTLSIHSDHNSRANASLSHSSARRGLGGGGTTSSKPQHNSRPPVSRRRVGCTVTTPYGVGKISKYDGSRGDNIIEVQLEWGATGYFHKKYVKPKRAFNTVGLSIEEIRKVAYSNDTEKSKARVLLLPDGRFPHTSPVVHHVFTSLVEKIGVQRLLAEAIDQNPATVSLWVHGRTSGNMTSTVESAFLRWLYDTDTSYVHAMALQNPPHVLAKTILANIASDGNKGARDNDADTSSNESRSEGDDDIVSMDDNDNSGTLSPRARRPIKGLIDEESDVIETRIPGRRRQHRPIDSELTSENGELLRSMMKQVMRSRKISQGVMAQEFVQLYNEDINQGGISCWFYYRKKEPVLSRVTLHGVNWVIENKQWLLNDEYCSQLPGLLEWAKQEYATALLDFGIEEGDGMSPRICTPRQPQHLQPLPPLPPQDFSGLNAYIAELCGAHKVVKCEEDNTSFSLALPCTVQGLASALGKEMKRRRLDTSRVAIEAGLIAINFGYAEVAAVLQLTCGTGEDAERICSALMLWLRASVQMTVPDHPALDLDLPDPLDEDENEDLGSSPRSDAPQGVIKSSSINNTQDFLSCARCSVCLRTKADFSSVKGFNLHLAWCKRKSLGIRIQRKRKNDDASSTVVIHTGGMNSSAVTSLQPPEKRMNSAVVMPSLSSLQNSTVGRPLIEQPKPPGLDSSLGGCSVGGEDNYDDIYDDIRMMAEAEVEDPVQSPTPRHTMLEGDNIVTSSADSRTATATSTDATGHCSFVKDQVIIASSRNINDPAVLSIEQVMPISSTTAAAAVLTSSSATVPPAPTVATTSHTASAATSSVSQAQVGAVPGRRKSHSIMDEFRDADVVLGDKFPLAGHYYLCEACKEVGNLLQCSTCPGAYHAKCAKDGLEEGIAIPATWHCPKCKESGVSTAQMLSSEDKTWHVLNGRWVFLFSALLRRWRQGFVVQEAPKPGIFLVKWLRSDNKGGKTTWVNLINSKVLLSRSGPAIVFKVPKATASSGKSIADSSNNRSGFSGGGDDAMDVVGDHEANNIGSNMEDDDDNEQKDDNSNSNSPGDIMSDTYVGSQSLRAALCAAGTACRAVDVVMSSSNTNAFACTRPPGHHAGRYGCSGGCLSTGFCFLNNAALSVTYARVRWGLDRVAVVDIDVHYGNGTAELLRNDPRAFFASVHMIYGEKNTGTAAAGENYGSNKKPEGFYPSHLGATEISDNFLSIGILPSTQLFARRCKTAGQAENNGSDEESDEMKHGNECVGDVNDNDGSNSSSADQANNNNSCVEDAARNYLLEGSAGYRQAVSDIIIPRLMAYNPQLLIISAGFDGFETDPLGGELRLSLDDYAWTTRQLMRAMDTISVTGSGRVVSLLEGGYDTAPNTLGLAKCAASHVRSLRQIG